MRGADEVSELSSFNAELVEVQPRSLGYVEDGDGHDKQVEESRVHVDGWLS